MEDGRGKSGEVILTRGELHGFPRVVEGFGVVLLVSEHHFYGGVIKGGVNGGLAGVREG